MTWVKLLSGTPINRCHQLLGRNWAHPSRNKKECQGIDGTKEEQALCLWYLSATKGAKGLMLNGTLTATYSHSSVSFIFLLQVKQSAKKRESLSELMWGGGQTEHLPIPPGHWLRGCSPVHISWSFRSLIWGWQTCNTKGTRRNHWGGAGRQDIRFYFLFNSYDNLGYPLKQFLLLIVFYYYY